MEKTKHIWHNFPNLLKITQHFILDGYRSRDSPLHIETSDRDRDRERDRARDIRIDTSYADRDRERDRSRDIRVDTSFGNNGRESRPEYKDMPSNDGYSSRSYR